MLRWISLLIWISCGPNAYAQNARDFFQKGLAQSDLNQVVAYMSKAIKLQPKMGEAYRYRAIAQYHQGKKVEAAKDLQIALALIPLDPEALLYRARLAEDDGKNEAALKDYSLIISRTPKYAEAYFRRGKLYERASKKASACSDYKQAKALGYPVGSSEMSMCTPVRKKD